MIIWRDEVNILPLLMDEMEREAQTTRKMLSRIPEDTYDWQPHEKSMKVRALAVHIAEIPNWFVMVLNTSELDFATTPYTPHPVSNSAELMAYFEQCLLEAKAAFEKATEEQLLEIWTMRSGEQIFMSEPKVSALRGCFCQIVHHRAQLGVYLRLLNIPIPGSYGPSADEMNAG